MFLPSASPSKNKKDADDPRRKYNHRRWTLSRHLQGSTEWLVAVVATLVSLLLLFSLSDHSTPFFSNPHRRLAQLEQDYAKNELVFVEKSNNLLKSVEGLLRHADLNIVQNRPAGVRFANKHLLPPLTVEEYADHMVLWEMQSFLSVQKDRTDPYFWTHRAGDPRPYEWKKEWNKIKGVVPPIKGVDYMAKRYNYPQLLLEPPKSGYPPMRPLGEYLDAWPQNEDFQGTYTETLLHFNFSNPIERDAAVKFRKLEVPFKMYDVPEVKDTAQKWTDDYLSQQLDRNHTTYEGHCQESVDQFFCFAMHWDIYTLGLPPVRNSDVSFAEFVQHAQWADAVQLEPERPHYYYQATDYINSRYTEENSFMGRDLWSFGQTHDTWFNFNVSQQLGIQCRFGERGVVAANHQDQGRNMVAMMHGAKRYILSPPKACKDLGIFPQRISPMYRHSALNYGNYAHINNPEMSPQEREWLKRAAASATVETVLKAGEVLYIPAHWFHYIVSLQRSSQCNVRSGDPEWYNPEFGDLHDVNQCGTEEFRRIVSEKQEKL